MAVAIANAPAVASGGFTDITTLCANGICIHVKGSFLLLDELGGEKVLLVEVPDIEDFRDVEPIPLSHLLETLPAKKPLPPRSTNSPPDTPNNTLPPPEIF